MTRLRSGASIAPQLLMWDEVRRMIRWPLQKHVIIPRCLPKIGSSGYRRFIHQNCFFFRLKLVWKSSDLRDFCVTFWSISHKREINGPDVVGKKFDLTPCGWGKLDVQEPQYSTEIPMTWILRVRLTRTRPTRKGYGWWIFDQNWSADWVKIESMRVY